MAIRILSSENITGKLTLTGQQELLELTRGGASDSKWFFSADSSKLYIAENTSATQNIKVTLKDDGNVGIGTISPDAKLEVFAGASTTQDDILWGGIIRNNANSAVNTGYGAGLKLKVSSDTTGEVNKWAGIAGIAGSTFSNVTDLAFYANPTASNVPIELMRLTGEGNVGIGTDDPDGKVHIFKGSNGATTVGTASDELILENDTDCGLTIRSGADSTGVVSFASPTDHNVGQLYYNHDDDSMVIRTNDAIRTIIGSSGIMYIMGATASTNNSLQLQYNSTAGSAEIYSKSTGGNTTFEFYTSSSGTTTQKFNIGSSGDVRITTNGKFLQGIRNTGSAAIDMIGFVSGTDTLQIKGGTSGAANAINFYDTGGFLGTWYNSNFGIGTTSPDATLDVHAPSTTAPSLTMGAAAGQIFKNEDLEFAFGLNNASPYNGWMQTRFIGNASRSFSINPLGGNVGIGTNSPGALLHIKGTGDAIRVESTNTGAGGAQIDLLHYSTSPADNDTMAYINMGGYYNTTPSQAYFSSIRTVATDISARQGELTFWTVNSTLQQRMVIDTNGNVGIGETSPTATLQVNGDIKIGTGAGSGTDSNNMSIQVSNATYGDTANLGLLVRNNGSNGQFAQIGFGYSESKCPVVIGSVITSGSGATKGDFIIGTRDSTTGSVSPTERMRIYSGGVVEVAGDLSVGGANKARFKSDGTNTYVDAIPANSEIRFRVAGAVEKFRIAASGATTQTMDSTTSLSHLWSQGVPLQNVWYTVYTYSQYDSVCFFAMVSFENDAGDGANQSAMFATGAGAAYGAAFAVEQISGGTGIEARRSSTSFQVRQTIGGYTSATRLNVRFVSIN